MSQEWNPPVKLSPTAAAGKPGCSACGGSGYVTRLVAYGAYGHQVNFEEYRPCECTRSVAGQSTGK